MPDWTYHPFFKPVLFRLPPETGRRLTLKLLELQARTAVGRRIFRLFGHGPPPPEVAVDVFGLHFPCPVGLAPGIDRDGHTLSVMQHLGFGFIEVGPLGAKEMLDRAATRPLRITERQTIIESWQARALSAAEATRMIARAPDLGVPIGVALRGDDLVTAVRDAAPQVGFFSLPPGCASSSALAELRALTPKPLLLRLSPDWSDDQLDQAIELAVAARLDGGVAVAGLRSPLLPDGEMDCPGLHARALQVIRHVVARYGARFPLIGAGGIRTPEDALDLLDAGARLVELHAGLVFAGPGLPGRILHLLEGEGVRRPPVAPAPNSLPRGVGWSLVALTGVVLISAGLFALLLAATVKLLPYDTRFLGMTVLELCGRRACRIVHFMAHDRVSFGGSIISVGLLYVALGIGPLRRGEAWAWWTLLCSGALGFGSFLTYLGYGYLDVWHGWATLALLPVYGVGMALSFRTLDGPRGPRALFRQGARAWRFSPAGMGRACLTFSAVGMIAGGVLIMWVGMTRVFVPQDLDYMRVTIEELNRVNPRLIPLIAHDRAGFGGGLCSGGVLVLLSLWCGARPGLRGLWTALFLGGLVGFGTAIGVHPVVGYTSFVHLLPAYLGALAFLIGIGLLYRPMCLDEPGDRFADL
jgi:dihydroorotate dehydrogenase